MIGNDVVDLDLASRQSNWRRKGFFKKVFSPAEQEIITRSQGPDLMVWLLWSMKEAAYKAHQREFKLPRRLNWLILECDILKRTSGNASGIVTVNGSRYYTTSAITSDYIYTSAEKTPDPGVKKAIFQASSSEVKKELKIKISEFLGTNFKELQFKKDAQGMPFLTSIDVPLFNQFSLSGHGRFYAYILSLINCETAVKHS